MKKNKFSIVTSTFNQGKQLEATIQSVVHNSYPDYEYIVVDRGSTDDTNDLAKTYSENISQYRKEKNRHKTETINKAFQSATGNIFAILEPGDYYFPFSLEKVAIVFEEKPEIDILYGDCVLVDEEKQFLRYFTEIEFFSPDLTTLPTKQIRPPVVFFRKKIFEKVKAFNPSFAFAFDWDFWNRCFQADAVFYYYPFPLAAGREEIPLQSKKEQQTRLKEFCQILQRQEWENNPSAFFQVGLEALQNEMEEGELKQFYLELFQKVSTQNKPKKKEKILYGLFPHSEKVENSVEYYLPWYEKAESFSFEVSSLQENQQMKLLINDKVKKNAQFISGETWRKFEIPLNPDEFDRYFHIKILFSLPKEEGVAASVKNLKIHSGELLPELEKDFFEVFVNTGQSFQPEQIGKVPITQQKGMLFQIDISTFSDIRQVRFDPLNSPGIVQLESLSLIDSQYREHPFSVDQVSTNASLKYEDIFIFGQVDPHFILDASGVSDIRDLKVKISYLSLHYTSPQIFESFLHLFSKLKNRVDQIENPQKSIPQYETKHQCQVSFDYGEGFSEVGSLTQHTSFDGNLEFRMDSTQSVKKIRISPLKEKAAIQMKGVWLLNEKGEREMLETGSITTNATLSYEDLYLFDHSDPQFILNLSPTIKPDTLKILFSYLPPYFSFSTKKTSGPKQCQIFFDIGNGFKEEDSLTEDILSKEVKLNINLRDFSRIDAIRIDPLEEECAIRLKGIALFTAEGKGTLLTKEEIRTNASFLFKDLYVFNHSDPQFVFSYPEGETFQKLQLSLEFLQPDVFRQNENPA